MAAERLSASSLHNELTASRNIVRLKDIEEDFGANCLEEITAFLYELGLYSKENPPPYHNVLQRHKGSQALYVLEEDRGDIIAYIQYMPKNSRSSEHRHPPQASEDYYVRKGSLYLYQTQIPQGCLTVNSGSKHQVFTHDEPSLTVLVTKNVLGIPRDKLHIVDR